MKNRLKKVAGSIKIYLSGLSFRTGVVVLLMAVPFYIISFAQMMLPISVAWKSTLWVIFFGLAKTAQYSGLAILGVEGYRKLKEMVRRRRKN